MQCHACKGKKGKNVNKEFFNQRTQKYQKYKTWQPCTNCNGTGELQDESNTTQYTLEQIKKLPVLKTFKNDWRQRYVTVHQHPDDKNMVISVGIPFNKGGATICEETKADYQL
jgi:hypothetical protein